MKIPKIKIINFKQNKIRSELQDIISGNERERAAGLIQTVSDYLKAGERTSGKTKKAKRGKEQETKDLIHLIDVKMKKRKLWNR